MATRRCSPPPSLFVTVALLLSRLGTQTCTLTRFRASFVLLLTVPRTRIVPALISVSLDVATARRLTRDVVRRAREDSPVRVLPMAALTKGREGREMTEIGFLRDAGAVIYLGAFQIDFRKQLIRLGVVDGEFRDFQSSLGDPEEGPGTGPPRRG